jgi:oxygen-independent coproporphyrinogen-3 oxidase
MSSRADRLGLYISIPFCRSKCTFCNFASGVYPASHHGRYVERLCEELRGARAQAENIGALLPGMLDSIYLGGGTPSVLEPELLAQLFDTIRAEFAVTRDAEITMECAPGQIDNGVLEAIVACGANRVSLGVQSFVDREAATSGRLHNRATALKDVERLRAAGIGRLSIDLIAGLPHQTLASWDESLEVLLATGVDHASIYMLEVDDDSRLGREMLEGGARYHTGAVPKDDTIATMFEQAVLRLAGAGMAQYELSNFAVSGQESKHNLKYWMRAPYLGVGVDAHSMLLRRMPGADGGTAVRFGYGDNLDAFLEHPAAWQPERLTRHAELEEALFLGLRLRSGVNLFDLREDFGGEAVDRFVPVIEQAEHEGLAEQDGKRILLTARGKLLSNEVFQAILEVGDEEFC